MDKRFWISGVLLAIASMALGFLIHGVLLSADYAALVPKGVMRGPDDANGYMPFMILADLAYGFGITWVFRQGWTPGRSAIGQGLRCGLAIAMVSTIPMFLIYYAVEPLPGLLVCKQLAFSTVQMLVLGTLAGLLNPSPKAA
jgi:hypothetical protein